MSLQTTVTIEILTQLALQKVLDEGHISKKLLSWRRKKKRGSIMKKKTFKAIERKAAAAGYDDPKAVAGAAYWATAKAKFKKRGKK